MNNYVEEIRESEQVCTYTKQIHVILDTRYGKEDLNNFMKNQCQHMTETQCNELLKLLQKMKSCSMENLAPRRTDKIDFKLNEGAMSICSRTYPVPKIH